MLLSADRLKFCTWFCVLALTLPFSSFFHFLLNLLQAIPLSRLGQLRALLHFLHCPAGRPDFDFDFIFYFLMIILSLMLLWIYQSVWTETSCWQIVCKVLWTLQLLSDWAIPYQEISCLTFQDCPCMQAFLLALCVHSFHSLNKTRITIITQINNVIVITSIDFLL